MTSRVLLERLFFSGAVFFDTSGGDPPYLGSNGIFFMRHEGTKIQPLLRDFIDTWSRAKDHHDELVADFVGSVNSLITRHGLVVLIHGTPRGDVLLSRDLPKLSRKQTDWLEEYFSLGNNDPVFWAKTVQGEATKTTIGAALFGGFEYTDSGNDVESAVNGEGGFKKPELKQRVKKNVWAPRGDEDEEFSQGVEARAASIQTNNFQKPPEELRAPEKPQPRAARLLRSIGMTRKDSIKQARRERSQL